jgi:cytidine deaminase
MPAEADRLIRLLFGDTLETPTPDEFGMFLARAAACRSSALGRQVGAVVTTPSGSVVAVGANETPKPGGGLCWITDAADRRDAAHDEDPSDSAKRRLVADLLDRLRKAKWLGKDFRRLPKEELAKRAMSDPKLGLRDSDLTGVTEFGSTVHAEMACLADAAMRGVSVAGCTLYTTTFPCHPCGRHIIAAGITRVVFIEPYPKSRLREFHEEEVALDEADQAGGRVSFHSFAGLAPTRYVDLFTMLERKDPDGRVIQWTPEIARLRIPPESSLASREKEKLEISAFQTRLETFLKG